MNDINQDLLKEQSALDLHDKNEKLKVRKNVVNWNLKRIPEFDKLTDEEFICIFNYFGPDVFPNFLRGILTWIYRNFIELSAVHDIEFYFSDGSVEGFKLTLQHWKENSKIMLDLRYPKSKFWLLPFRIIAAWKLNVSYEALKSYSYTFYVNCKTEFAKRKLALFHVYHFQVPPDA